MYPRSAHVRAVCSEEEFSTVVSAVSCVCWLPVQSQPLSKAKAADFNASSAEPVDSRTRSRRRCKEV